jgi:hypothetical protein
MNIVHYASEKIQQFCAKAFSCRLRPDEYQKILYFNINVLQTKEVFDYQPF